MTRASRALRALPLWMHFMLLIGVFIIVALVSAAYIHHATYRDAEKAAHAHALYAAHVAAQDIGKQVVQLKTQIHTLAATPGLELAFTKPEQCRLQAVGGHIDVIPPNGIVKCSSSPPTDHRDYSHAAWFKAALHGDVFQAPVRDTATGHWVVVAASPLPNGRGVAAGLFNLEQVGSDFARRYSGGEPFLFVISDGRRIIARSVQPHSYIGRPVKPGTPQQGLFTATDLNGISRFFAPERVPGTDWRLVAGEKTSAATAPGRALERRQFGILVVGLLFMLGAVVGVYWLLLDPIREMRTALQSDAPVPTGGPAELGRLAGEINALLNRQERERQAQKMEALGRLASGIAHDFNNLLVVISGGARLLIRRGRLDERDGESVDRIDRAAHRGQQLTNQLLAFARQRALNPVPTDVNVTVREMTVMLDRVLGSKIQTVIELTPELPAVLIDEGQLAQVVLNLAINARDAMPSGGKLTISTSQSDIEDLDIALPGRYVQIEVHDTGTGMDAETAARAFDPFFTTKDEGTGLGLATVHGIVTGAGGLIDVTSHVGQGTTIRISLPNSALASEMLTEPQEVS